MVRMSRSTYKGQRTTLWSRPSPSTFRWDPGVKLRLPDLCVGEAFSLLSQPPYRFSIFASQSCHVLQIWLSRQATTIITPSLQLQKTSSEAALSDSLKLLRVDSSGCSLSQVTLLFNLSRRPLSSSPPLDSFTPLLL